MNVECPNCVRKSTIDELSDDVFVCVRCGVVLEDAITERIDDIPEPQRPTPRKGGARGAEGSLRPQTARPQYVSGFGIFLLRVQQHSTTSIPNPISGALRHQLQQYRIPERDLTRKDIIRALNSLPINSKISRLQ